MQNLHITCENLEQKNRVMNELNRAGFENLSKLCDGILDIQTSHGFYVNTSIRTASDEIYLPKITYQQFMEKYSVNTLKQTIAEAKTKLNVSQRKLSTLLGKSEGYLSEMVRIGCSTEKQTQLIEQIKAVMDGEVFKSDEQIIKELTEKLAEAQDGYGQALVAVNEISLLHAELTAEKTALEDQLHEAYKTIEECAQEATERTTHLESQLYDANVQLKNKNAIQAILGLIIAFLILVYWVG